MGATDLRTGNEALLYFIENYAVVGEEKCEHLLECLPDLASSLSRQARSTAETLLKAANVSEPQFSSKSAQLADCVFDLMLVPCFGELEKYIGDKECASVFLDALLYEVTGHEPELPTELQFRHEGTHLTHGIAKYKAGRDFFKNSKIGYVEGWIFGKEYSVIVCDRVSELDHILGVQPITFLVIQHARWMAKYCLFGTLPTKDEEKQLNSMVDDLRQKYLAHFARFQAAQSETQ